MFFKLRRRQITIVLVSLPLAFGALFGCSGQNAPYNSIRNIQLSGAQCMEQIPGQIHDYFNGKASVGETRALWGCFHYVLSMFSTYVRSPGTKGAYTPRGLREFLEKYFLAHEVRGPDGHVISNRLLAELMELKTIFVGGSSQVITHAEIQHTLVLLNDLNNISVKLLPYTRFLFGKSAGAGPSSAQVDRALQVINEALTSLPTVINPDHASYSFAHLQSLLQGIHNFLVRQNSSQKYIDLSPYIPLVAKVKAVILNSNSTAIEPQDWVPLTHIAVQLYSLFVRKQYFLTTNSLERPNQLNELSSMFSSITDILESAAQRRPNGVIPLKDIDSVVDAAIPFGFLPKTFDQATANAFMKTFFDTILNPQGEFSKSGISADKIQYLQNQVSDWVQVQNALIEGKSLPKDPGWIEMTHVLNGPWPLRVDSYGRLIFNWRSKAPVNLASATRLNWSRAVFHVLFQAYIKNKTRLKEGELSQTELHQAYLDLKPVLVMFNLDSPSDTTFDQRLFRDANLFMPRSNDDNYLSFYELIEYVQNVISGIDAGKVFMQTLPKNCYLAGGLISEPCFRSSMQKNYGELMANMPDFRSYAKGLSQTGWNNILTYVEETVRAHGATSVPMSQSSVDESFILLQYVETLMLRFDTDHDGSIGPLELVKMLRFFKHALIGGLRMNSVEPQPSIQFRYPAQINPQWWFFSLDRGRLLEIIAYLSQLNS